MLLIVVLAGIIWAIIVRVCVSSVLVVVSRCFGRRRKRPVVFGDAGPEDPDHDDRQEGKECFKESSVDGSVGCSAKVYADDILEDLSDGEEEHCCDKVD